MIWAACLPSAHPSGPGGLLSLLAAPVADGRRLLNQPDVAELTACTVWRGPGPICAVAPTVSNRLFADWLSGAERTARLCRPAVRLAVWKSA
jgi:hypothetical protein